MILNAYYQSEKERNMHYLDLIFTNLRNPTPADIQVLLICSIISCFVILLIKGSFAPSHANDCRTPGERCFDCIGAAGLVMVSLIASLIPLGIVAVGVHYYDWSIHPAGIISVGTGAVIFVISLMGVGQFTDKHLSGR